MMSVLRLKRGRHVPSTDKRKALIDEIEAAHGTTQKGAGMSLNEWARGRKTTAWQPGIRWWAPTFPPDTQSNQMGTKHQLVLVRYRACVARKE